MFVQQISATKQKKSFIKNFCPFYYSIIDQVKLHYCFIIHKKTTTKIIMNQLSYELCTIMALILLNKHVISKQSNPMFIKNDTYCSKIIVNLVSFVNPQFPQLANDSIKVNPH